MRPAEIAAKVAFEKRLDEIKDDIEAGRITFRKQPEIRTEKMLNITALKCVLLIIAAESKWN